MKLRIKKMLAVIICFSMIVGIIPVMQKPVAVKADDLSGTCGAEGNNITWELVKTGENTYKLTLTGNGAMEDYSQYDSVTGAYTNFSIPWEDYHSLINEIVISEGITRIGNAAFENTSVKAINIPGTVTSIGEAAFCYCEQLTSVFLQEGLKIIGKSAFYGCNSLKSVTIPDSVNTIEEDAFKECSIEAIDVGEGNNSYCVDGGVLFSKDKTELVWYPQNLDGATYTIPETVKIIKSSAFYNNSKLTSVILPEGLEEIEAYAFSYVASIASIKIPETVKKIGKEAFTSNSYDQITICGRDTEIDTDAFSAQDGTVYSPAETECANLDACIINIVYICTEPQIIQPEFTYDGSEHTVITATDNSGYVINGNTGAEIGDYTATAVLKSDFTYTNVYLGKRTRKYFWGDVENPSTWASADDKSDKIYNWSIVEHSSYKNDQKVTAPVAASNLVYNGGQQDLIASPAVVTAGNTDDGSIMYSLNNTDWSADVPQGTDAGDYTVYYKVAGNETYNEFVGNSVEVKIERANPKTPSGIIAYEGQTLADVELPENWAWVDSTTSLVEGSDFFKANYISPDNNHNSISNVSIMVSVYPPKSGTTGGCTWSISDDRSVLTISKSVDGDGIIETDFRWEFYKNTLLELIINDGVKSIASEAFSDYQRLKSVTIPGSVEYIGEKAFKGCIGLKSLIISDGVTRIGRNAFEGCNMFLKEVYIPGSVEIIDAKAFYECLELEKVTISEGVKQIGWGAFSSNSKLSSVTIGVKDSLEIRESAFPSNNLSSITFVVAVPETGFKKITVSTGELTAETNGTLSMYDVESALKLSVDSVTPTITIVDSVYTGSALQPAVTVKVGDETLTEDTDYTVTYSDNTNAGTGTVTITGKGFYGGTVSETFSIGKADTVAPTGLTANEGDTLADVALPVNWVWADSTVSVGTAGTKTFKANYTSSDTNHKDMTNVDVTVTVNALPTSGTIGGCTWALSDDLRTLTIAKAADGDGGIGYVYPCPWDYASAYITKAIICDGVKSINGAFIGCVLLEDVTIPNSVIDIDYAFSGCTSLKSVIIPDSVTSIGENTFEECSALTEIIIPGSVKYIFPGAFSDCSLLEKVTISEGVETIAMCAFEDCTNLSSVTIGVKDSLMIVGAFTGCDSLNSVTFVVSDPETGFKKLVVSVGELAAATNGTFTMSDLDSRVEMSVENVNLTVTLADSSFTWTGSSIEPAITVKDGEKILTVGTDYTVEYSNNVNAGTGKVTVKGTGMYVGSASKEFSIEKIEAPNKPDSVINVGFTTGKVSDISLPTGWTWAESDKTKTLDIGTSVTATSEYTGSNKENYNNTSVNVSILRSSCTHRNLVKTDAVDATCTTGGNSAYWTCQDCGAYFSDENGTNVISANSWIIDKLGHEYGTPSYVWSDDYSSCTATVICVRSGCAETADGHKITETVETTSRVVKGATVDVMGTTEYTASFKNTSYFAKQMKEVDDIEKLTPGTTDPETPGTTDPETPGTTDSETPSTTDPETPGTTDPETPSTTDSEPSNPTPSGNGNSGSGNTNNTTNTNNQNTSNNTNNTTNTNNQNTGKTSTETEKLPDPVVTENKDGSTTTTSVSKDIFGTPVTKIETTFKDGTKVTEETSVNAYGTEKVKEKITEKDGSVIETSTTKYADNTSTVAKTVTNPDNSSVNYNALISANGTQTFTEEKKAADGSSSRTTGTVNVSGSGSTNTVNKDASGAVIGTVDTKTYESGKSVIASTEGAGDSKVTNKVSVNLSGIAKLTSLIANSGIVNIPASIEANDKEYSISILGKYLMMRNKNIINVTIGNNITTIGYKAFYRASNLSVIEMTASVQSISKFAFKRIAKDAKFIITASDEDFERLVNLIKESGVSKTVTFEQVKPKKAKK